MKKIFPILLILAVFFLGLQFVVNIFVKERDTEYVIKTEVGSYNIKEYLKVVGDDSYYDVTISPIAGEEYYISTFNKDFNKQSQVIKDIKKYESNDVRCILPILKKKKVGNLACYYKGQQVSYSYLKQINSSDIQDIVTQIKNDGYDNKQWSDKSTNTSELSESERSIRVYDDNLIKEYTFLIWRYRGLYILRDDIKVVKDYLEHDQYDNTNSMLVGKYYVSANTLDDRTNEVIYYNTKELGRGRINLLDTTSNDYYFNGAYKGKLYFTDVKKEVQYAVDISKENVEEVGNRSDGFVGFKNDKLISVKRREFLKDKYYFDELNEVKELKKLYSDILDVAKQRKYYYFRKNDGGVYRVNEDNLSKPELLAKFDNLVEMKAKDGAFIAVDGETLYFYDDYYGLLPIAINKELKYNYKNICDFYRE